MLYKSIIKNKNKIAVMTMVIGAFLFSFASVNIKTAEAATLSLRPSSQSVSKGNIVSVRLIVNTDGKYVNNTEGSIQFPTDLLDVLSVSKSSSIFSLWVEEPRFSNYDGSVSFNGGVPNPGYIGSGGEVISITFKAKKAGNASVMIADASVRENDGLGTDILNSKSGASIQIQDAQADNNTADTTVKPTTPTTAKSSAPDKPTVLSSTHPKQDIWYKGTSALFSWSVPASVTSVQASLNKTEMSVPTVSYDGSVSRKTLNDLTDGTYFFNLRLKNGEGWSPTSHYKIHVDNTAPEDFTPNVEDRDGKNIVKLIAEDKNSGIDHYVVSVDSQDNAVNVDPQSLTDNEYQIPPQSKGQHILNVLAYDKAGNKREVTASFVSSGVVPPEISLSADSIEVGDSVTVSGTSIYPNTKVEVSVAIGGAEPKKYQQVTGADGSFQLVIDDLKNRGTVIVTANLVLGDSKTIESLNKLQLKIGDPKSLESIKNIVYPAFEIVFILLVMTILLFAIYLGWHKFFGLRKRYRDDLQVMAESVHKTMLLLKKELNSQLKTLEKIQEDRNLNEKEERIFEEIQNNIDDVEKFIQKKIKKLL